MISKVFENITRGFQGLPGATRKVQIPDLFYRPFRGVSKRFKVCCPHLNARWNPVRFLENSLKFLQNPRTVPEPPKTHWIVSTTLPKLSEMNWYSLKLRETLLASPEAPLNPRENSWDPALKILNRPETLPNIPWNFVDPHENPKFPWNSLRRGLMPLNSLGKPLIFPDMPPSPHETAENFLNP